MNDDIVARLRFNAMQFGKMSKPGARTTIHSEFIVQMCEDWRFAADEIERLRAERNQLRAEIVDRVLQFRADVPWNSDSEARMKCEAYAAERGWIGLYDEINKRVAESEVADG